MASRKNDYIDLFNDTQSLEDYFNSWKKQAKEAEDYRRKIQNDTIQAQSRAVKQAYVNFEKEKQQLIMSGVKVTQDLEYKMKKTALKKFNEEKKKDELALQNKLFKEIYGIQTGYDEKRRRDEIKANKEKNQELIAYYKKQEELGKKLTEQQKEDLKRAQEEVAEANKIAVGDFIKNVGLNLANTVSGTMEAYSKNQAKINTRLIGSAVGGTLLNPYNRFGGMETRLTNAVGVQPYFKTEVMLENLNSLVELGIVSNLEQRAFLQTAKDGIATTFDVANGALLRIIRLQQSDSTAMRLGMEAYLTRFLNNLVDNTEYMNQTFDNVASALLEASSVMGAAQASEFEYVVQKWLGALTGTGLSETTATNIAQAIGQLGSGNISALGNSSMMNLLTMASSRAGLDIGTLLTSGLNNATTDALLKSLVEYMVELGGSGNNVVRSELAQTFGLTFSDLQAARQISSSIGDIYGNRLTSSGMYGELSGNLSTLAMRTPMATMLDTLWSNLEFGVGSNIAKNPALAAIWKVTDLIQQNTGGIKIPAPLVAGTGVTGLDTVENLIKLGVVGAGSLGMIGDLISGVSSTFAPSSILGKLNISPVSTGISRGGRLGTAISGLSSSFSATTVRANSSGEDIASSTITGAMEEGNAKVREASEEVEDNTLKIKNYLTDTLEAHMDALDRNISTLASDVDEIKSRMIGFGLGV